MSNSVKNPFVYGGPVSAEQFIGRREEINRVKDQLTSHALGSLAIIGERRIGKTSLMHYVSAPDVVKAWNLDETKSLFIYQDCGSIAPFTITNFWKTVLRWLSREIQRKNATPIVYSMLQTLLAQNEINFTDIGFLLKDMHDAGFIFILMLDEFEWCVRTDPEMEAVTRDFLAGLRALINQVPRVFSLIVATRAPLHEVCRDVRFMSSPFYNNFVFIYLRPFNQEEAELLLQQMLANAGMTFSKSEKDFIYGLAGTHPLLLQAAASLVFELKLTGASQMQDLFPIRAQFREQVEHQFEDYWKWSPIGLRQILAYLAFGKYPEAMARLENWVDERQTLLRRGLLVERQTGQYRIFSPVFQEWLTENGKRLGVHQWLGEQLIAAPERSVSSQASPTVFISYSHKDEKEKDALLAQLGVLQQAAGLIDLWSDTQIGGGENWEEAIGKAMDKAKVALFLISANFLTSSFILSKEVPRLLERRTHDGLIVIPVIAKHCAWRNVEWLARINVRPRNAEPVWAKGGVDADERLSAIAEEVASIMKSANSS